MIGTSPWSRYSCRVLWVNTPRGNAEDHVHLNRAQAVQAVQAVQVPLPIYPNSSGWASGQVGKWAGGVDHSVHHTCSCPVESAAADPSRDPTPLLSTSSHPPPAAGRAAQNGTLPPGRQLRAPPFGLWTRHEMACRDTLGSAHPACSASPTPPTAHASVPPRFDSPRLASSRLPCPALAPSVDYTSPHYTTITLYTTEYTTATSHRAYHGPVRLGLGAVRSSLDPPPHTTATIGPWKHGTVYYTTASDSGQRTATKAACSARASNTGTWPPGS